MLYMLSGNSCLFNRKFNPNFDTSQGRNSKYICIAETCSIILSAKTWIYSHLVNFIFIQDISKSLLHYVMASLALVCRCNTSRKNSNLLLFSWTVRKMSIELYIFPVPPPLDVPIHVSEVYNDPEDILFVVYVC